MLYVGGSNRVEKLVVALLKDIQERRKDDGFYKKINVLTPNPTVNKFLEFELARRGTISANIEFTHLHKFLEKLAEKHPDLRDVTILDRAKVQVLIQDVLSESEFFNSPELTSVRAYIEAVDTPAGQQTRAYQLSLRLAKLFEEYDYSRQAMLAAWAKNQNYYESENAETWQRVIWFKLFGGERIVIRKARRFMPLSKVFDTYAKSQIEIPGIDHLHVFGFQHISPTILNALHSLAQTTDICVWMLQPGPVKTGGVQGWVFENAAHPAIQQWGASASDMLTVFSQNTQEAARFVDLHELEGVAPTTAIAALRAQIFDNREPTEALEGSTKSVAFHACRGIQREIEAVADDIWARMLGSDKNLRFDEIGVIVAGADREEYVAQIRSVFKSFHSLPRSFVGLPNADKSPVVEAFTMLLELPYTNFGRRSFMGLMLHPNVQASVPGSDAQAWTKWCDNLSILFGADKKHQGETYIEKDFYNWSQGFKRLALGSFLSVDDDGKNCFQHAGQEYLVEHVSQSQVGEAARMSTLARSLIEDARWLHDAEFTLERWAEVFENLLKTYIHPATNHKAGSASFKKDHGDIGLCRHLVKSLAERDLVGQVYSYRTASLMLLTELDALDISREGELHRGVVVGTAGRLSHVPFKHTYVVGLGEGQFPGVDRDDPMDLRQAEQLAGDEGTRARDRQAFLDIVLNARESLSLSWVAHDATTGEALEPSSLLHEFRDFLGKLGVEVAVKKHKLRRYEVQETRHPEALIEAELLKIGRGLRAQTQAADKSLPTAFTVVEHLRAGSCEHAKNAAAWMQMPVSLGAETGAKAEGQRDGRALRISLSQLRGFLESPLQGAAKIQLRMNEDEKDSLLVVNEPFASDRMNKSVFLRRVFHEAVVRGFGNVDFGELHDEMLLPFYELNGTLPTGFFLEKTREKHVQILKRWQFFSEKWIKSGHWKSTETVKVFHFGHEERPGSVRLAPLTFELDIKGVPTTVELVGSSELFCEASGALITCVTQDKPNKKHFSRGYASYLALAASGQSVERILINFTSLANSQKATMDQLRGELDELDAGIAYQFLQTILQEILCESHAYLLPIELVEAYLKDVEGFDAPRWIVEVLDDPYGRISDKYGPLKNYADFQAPPNWAELLNRRFQYFPGFSGVDEKGGK